MDRCDDVGGRGTSHERLEPLANGLLIAAPAAWSNPDERANPEGNNNQDRARDRAKTLRRPSVEALGQERAEA